MTDTATPTVSLHNLLPLVFAGEEQMHRGSEIWLREDVTFLPDLHYLVNAESGKGKTSLCSFIYGVRDDYSGTILFEGKNLRDLSLKEVIDLRRKHIAYLPQELQLFPSLTAIENIRLKNRLTGFRSDTEIRDLMEEAGILQFADRPAGKLSLGQQQRVATVRALCQPFSLLLLDEPVSHLDRESNLRMAAMIDREARAQGATVITTSVGNPLLLPDCITVTL